MLTADANFLLNEFLKPSELANTVRALRSDEHIKSRSYSVDTGTLTIFNVNKLLFKPTNHYQMIAKGLVVHESPEGTYTLACIPLTKFYNMFESVAQSDLEKAIAEDMVVYPLKKHDGTLINRFVWNFKVYFATRSVILNLPNPDLEINGEEFAPSKFMRLIDELHNKETAPLFSANYYSWGTLSFELVGPQNLILEKYEDPELIFISRVDHDYLFQYIEPDISLSWSVLSNRDGSFPASDIPAKVEHLLKLQTGKIVEGYILVAMDKKGTVRFRFKVKTPEYLELLKIKNYVSKNVIVENYPSQRYKTFDEFSTWAISQFDTQAISYAEELIHRYRTIWDEYDFTTHFANLESKFEEVKTWALSTLPPLTPREQYELASVTYPDFRGVAVGIARGKSPDTAFLNFYKGVSKT